MGNTVWILSDTKDSDDWDHTFLLKLEKSLNKLSKEIGVANISDFYDNSILAGEFGGEVEPKLTNSSELEKVLSSLITAIKQGNQKSYKKNQEFLKSWKIV